MLEKAESKARILSLVLDFLHRHKWRDLDDFSLRLTDKVSLSVHGGYLSYSGIWQATKTSTNFFVVNHLKREKFCNLFMTELCVYLEEIEITTRPGILSFTDLFPEIKSISDVEAQGLLPKLDMKERAIQDALRSTLRGKGATNMVGRKSDSALEVADLEDFTLKVDGRPLSFTAVVKGFNSVGLKVRLEDVMHQVVKAFNGTYPDYILLMLAKDPVDGVISNLVRYGESVGNRDLVITADPVDTARFLRAQKVI